MIVVPVLMTNCHVSLKPKIGPVASHTRTMASAAKKAAGLPARIEAFRANRSNPFRWLVASGE